MMCAQAQGEPRRRKEPWDDATTRVWLASQDSLGQAECPDGQLRQPFAGGGDEETNEGRMGIKPTGEMITLRLSRGDPGLRAREVAEGPVVS
ncbi:hypothetical protein FDECE_18467 [Fusarium decemcellulare]|nr:hypothetical protein FDECE_18467 [Fusarium decemcellulare]